MPACIGRFASTPGCIAARSSGPGLVLGLDHGGVCRGVAYRVAAAEAERVIAYLREREQVTAVYRERMRPMRFDDGGAETALSYLVDRAHAQYAGKLDEETQFRLVAAASGRSGANRDYVVNTASHLAELGIPDPLLARLAARLRQSPWDDASGGAAEERGLFGAEVVDDGAPLVPRPGEKVQVERGAAGRRSSRQPRQRRHLADPHDPPARSPPWRCQSRNRRSSRRRRR